MQKVGAYLLERRDGMFETQARNAEAESLRAAVRQWLEKKGAAKGAPSGAYDAEDGSHATFTSEKAEDAGLSWSMVRLEETGADGRKFVAGVSVTTLKEAVVVYVSLEAGAAASAINAMPVRPKGPRIVRALLALPGHWYHGASRLRALQRYSGFAEGEELAQELLSPERTLPWVVVSERGGRLALDGLEDKLTHELAGLANIARVDSDAAWALTDHLGKPLSCYAGAVRIYWPRLTVKDDLYRHSLWTAGGLQSVGEDQARTLGWFGNQLRGRFMRAAALSVVRPREIDTIRANAASRPLEELKARASALADDKEIAEAYLADNESLKSENKKLNERINDLAGRIASLEETNAGLQARLENAEVQLRYREEEALIPESAPEPATEEVGPPERGETRFYKKKHSTPGHDIMVRVADCGCNNWQGGHAGDKAKKGIARLEDGRNNWSKIHHCGSCTGGGMWRVVW